MKNVIRIQTCASRLAVKTMLSAALLAGLAIVTSATAHAQMVNQPWGFTQQNRASIAALMKQTEDKENERQAVTTSASGYDQLVCGKDGDSSATGNNTCIIMNNSNGSIQIGQDANGSQTATSNTETTVADSMSGILDDIASPAP